MCQTTRIFVRLNVKTSPMEKEEKMVVVKTCNELFEAPDFVDASPKMAHEFL